MILPELRGFLAVWQRHWAPVPASATAAQRRAHFERVALAMRLPTPEGVAVSEHWIDVPDNGPPTRVLAFASAGQGRPRAAVIYLHGGAWMQGSPETHWDITARLAAANDHVVISVDYALAPERPFPAALNDVTAVVHWCHGAGATALGLDPSRIAVAGDSAGGNLAAAVCLRLRGTSALPCAQLLIYPGLDGRLDRASHLENADGPIIRVADMPKVNAMYCPDAVQRGSELVHPLRARSFAGLPPAYVAVAEHDPLRDEGIAFADALAAAGVAVERDAGPGLIHGYLRAMDFCAASRESLARMAGWLGRQLA